MQCPKCGGKSKVYGVKKYCEIVERVRFCKTCSYKFKSLEEIVGEVRPWNRVKDDTES